FTSSGILLGASVGGAGVVFSVRLLGPANILVLRAATLGAGALLVRRMARRYRFLEVPKARRSGTKPNLGRTLAEGSGCVRVSALFTAMALTTLASMIAVQL